MAYTLVPTELIQDGAVTSAKLDTNIAISGTLSVAGVTTLATHLVMGDNDKIKIGTGGDLEIYHDASNSYIANSTGNLYIGDTNGSVHIQAKLNEDSIVAAADGAVTLYYDNAAKLATSSAGVTVTGALAATLSTAAQPNITSVGTLTALTGGTGDLNWDSGTLFVDSSANAVGIGIVPSEGKLHIKSDGSGEVELLTLENSTGTNGKTTLTFKTTSTDATKSAQIFAERVNASGHTDLAFRTYNGSTTEAVRIDHDGNLLVGGTSAEAANSTTLYSSGQIVARSSSGTILELRRDTASGEIIKLRNNAGQIGSIGVTSGSLGIGQSNTGLGFFNNDRILFPATAVGAVQDNAIDLGYVSGRFKDLYLSGGVVFDAVAGNATSNTLDDYEEGTWTPAVTGMQYQVRTGNYTKIGDLVFIKLRLTWDAYNNSAGGVLTGLPFAADASNESMAFSVYANSGFGSIPSGKGYLNAYVSSNNTTLNFTWQPNTVVAEFASVGNIYVAGTYLT